ncbi:discoidin domain-containing protein [Methylobacterium sp. D54C]
MIDFMKHYGVTKELLESNGIDADATSKGERSSEREIRDALQLLVPRRSGTKLIRLGGDLDGGYLLPNDLAEISACFSPGTNNFKRFEDQLAIEYGITSFMCDYSSNKEQFATPLINGMQFFQKKWLDVDGADNSLSLDDWVQENSQRTGDLLLQMDIEGAEYRNFIGSLSATLERFRIIIVEIHNLQHLENRDFLCNVFLPAMQKIARSHISVHVHANNCCGYAELYAGQTVPCAVEATFLRKDRVHTDPDALVLPHSLDRLNVGRYPPIHLGGLWLAEADEVRSRLNALEQSVTWLTARVTNLVKSNSFLINNVLLRPNVALGKQATQSSLSIYSTEQGAAGGVSGTRSGRFGFHTDEEQDPWWMVDLGKPHQIDGCLIFNRMDGASTRADTLQVLTSLDGNDWTLRYLHSGRPTFGGIVPYDGEPPLLLDMSGITARFIRLRLSAFTALHLDEVEVYGRPI